MKNERENKHRILHRLSATDYHASEGVSNSSLKWFRKSPAHYKAFRDGKIANEPTKPQQIGTLTHALILEGKADFVTAPTAYPIDAIVAGVSPKPWNRNATYCKEWEASQKHPVISLDQAATIRAAQAAIKSHPLASALLSNGMPEASLYATCPKTGLLLKCRVDWLSGRRMVDLKTAQDASTRGFKRAIASYGYHHQAAFYTYVAQLCGLDIVEFDFIALELEPIPMPNVLILSEADLELATMELHKTLRELAECEELGEWKGYCGQDANKVTLPAYVHDTAEETLTLTGATEII